MKKQLYFAYYDPIDYNYYIFSTKNYSNYIHDDLIVSYYNNYNKKNVNGIFTKNMIFNTLDEAINDLKYASKNVIML